MDEVSSISSELIFKVGMIGEDPCDPLNVDVTQLPRNKRDTTPESESSTQLLIQIFCRRACIAAMKKWYEEDSALHQVTAHDYRKTAVSGNILLCINFSESVKTSFGRK